MYNKDLKEKVSFFAKKVIIFEISNFSFKVKNVRPILHKEGHFVPTHVDDSMCCFCGCPKWANFSWLCFFQHLPSPIDTVFEKKFEKIEKL